MPVARKPTVCIDLDGVLAEWDGKWDGVEKIGAPIAGAVEFTKELSKLADVLVWTTRTNEEVNFEFMTAELRDIVAAWLNEHGFSYRAIYIGSGKPLAAAYIDDRAVVCRPQRAWAPSAFSEAMERVKELLPGPVAGKGEAGK